MKQAAPSVAPPTVCGIDSEQIRAQLACLLASRGFEASDRRRAFLEFVVEETLAGRADTLKGYTIGHAVFDRGDDFDAQSDPVVRLEARRLRRDLDGYYMGAGASDPVRILIPKGGYVPQFEWQVHPGAMTSEAATPDASHAGPHADLPASSARTQRWQLTLIGLVAGAAIAFASSHVLRWRNPYPAPAAASARVAVIPFDNMDGGETSQVLSSGLSWEVVQDLKKFESLRVFQPATPVPDRTGGQPGTSYVVRGNVLTEAGNVEISVQLLDAFSQEILWARKYAVKLDPRSLMDTRDTISGEIANLIAQPYGPIATNVRKSSARFRPGTMESYLCLLRSHDYRRAFSAAKFREVFRCLEETVRRQPDYGDALAMLALLHLDAARYEFFGRDKRQAELAKGLELASRAVELAPENAFALSALSSLHHHMGHYAEGERLARKALELNPYDPDTLAQLGWRLAVRGNFDEGIPYLQQAISRSVAPPGWYYHQIAIHQLMQGEYAGMLETANHAVGDGGQFSIALVAMAAAGLGDREMTRQALAMLDPKALFSRDPEEFIRNHGATDEIVSALMTALRKAQGLADKG